MFKKIKGYSRGMKQRLGIAQALINNLSVLLLDETTVGVDPKERFRFRKILSALSKIESSCYPLHIVSGVIAVKLARK